LALRWCVCERLSGCCVGRACWPASCRNICDWHDMGSRLWRSGGALKSGFPGVPQADVLMNRRRNHGDRDDMGPRRWRSGCGRYKCGHDLAFAGGTIWRLRRASSISGRYAPSPSNAPRITSILHLLNTPPSPPTTGAPTARPHTSLGWRFARSQDRRIGAPGNGTKITRRAESPTHPPACPGFCVHRIAVSEHPCAWCVAR